MSVWPVITLRTFIVLTFCFFLVNFFSRSGAIKKEAMGMGLWVYVDPADMYASSIFGFYKQIRRCQV